MKYPLNELDSKEFENLVVSICEVILGTGTINFSDGKDGGRDAKFNGTSKEFPSNAGPWTGKFIIQAKHTTNPIASCSDSDFQTILKKEVDEKLIPLKKSKKVDFYLLFTNRKLSGIQDAKIEDLIQTKTGITNNVFGIERILKWLNDNPKIIKDHGLNRLLLPLQFYEEDLKDIIIAYSKISISPEKIKEITEEIKRIDIYSKNSMNNLTKEYFDIVFNKSFQHFESIKKFLSDPKNNQLKEMYDNTIDDLQEKILINRDDYSTFDRILSYLYDFVLDKNYDLLKSKRNLIRIFLHYMYYNCDIGIKGT